MVSKWSVITDHLPINDIKKIWSVFCRNLVGNYRPFGDHLLTNDIKKIWSVFGRNLVGNYRPFGDHLSTKLFRSVNGRKIVGNGLSVNGR